MQRVQHNTAPYTPYEAPSHTAVGAEHIGRNWFISLGEYVLQFQDGDAKLSILKKLLMERRRRSSAVSWVDLEAALAHDDFTMPRLTRLFTTRSTRQDRIAMFAEALHADLTRKTFNDWKIVKYTASNGEMYFTLRGPKQHTGLS